MILGRHHIIYHIGNKLVSHLIDLDEYQMVLVIVHQACHPHLPRLIDLGQEVGLARDGIVILADVAITVLPPN